MPCAQPSAEARAGQARGAVVGRAVDRARGLHGSADQGLLPPVSRQQGAPALRLRGRMHRLRQGRRRARSPRCTATTCPTPSRARPVRTAIKVKGNIHWVCGAARVRKRGAALRPAVPRAASGDGRRAISCDDLNPDARKVIRAQLEPSLKQAQAGGALPVRAARLLRRRPDGFQARRAGFQSGGDAARFLDYREVVRLRVLRMSCLRLVPVLISISAEAAAVSLPRIRASVA